MKLLNYIKLIELLKEGPRTIGEICEALNLPKNTVNYMISVLKREGLVECTYEKRGQNIHKVVIYHEDRHN